MHKHKGKSVHELKRNLKSIQKRWGWINYYYKKYYYYYILYNIYIMSRDALIADHDVMENDMD